MKLLLERAASRENRAELYGIARRPGRRASSSPAPSGSSTGWPTGEASTAEEVGARLKVDPARLHEGVDALVAAGMVERVMRDGSRTVVVTPSGEEAMEKLTIARRQSLTEVLEGWDPEDHPEVVEMIRNLAKALLADDDRLLADAQPSAVV